MDAGKGEPGVWVSGWIVSWKRFRVQGITVESRKGYRVVRPFLSLSIYIYTY